MLGTTNFILSNSSSDEEEKDDEIHQEKRMKSKHRIRLSKMGKRKMQIKY